MEQTQARARALLVDDDSSVCKLLSEKLSQEGFSCWSAASGEEALKLLKEQAFDVVISDLRMPGISGLELLEQACPKYPHATFLMATGVDDLRIGVQAMKKGAADYLLKPLQMEETVRRVQQALEKKRLELEVENYRCHLEKMVEQRTKQLQAAAKRIEQTYDDTLEALGAALDLRDTGTEGHSRRVRDYCLEIARRTGCPDDELKNIARGAYLHDIGKIGIPDAILLKPGKLTPEERAVMETHARIGYELLSRIPFLAGAAEIVLTHQESYDGTGYPQGLAGDENPLGARIFAAADTLDAMTSDRPYRRALPLSAAREEIMRESGRQFDPKVVEVFLAIPEQVWEGIRLEGAGRRAHLGAPLSPPTRPGPEPTTGLPSKVAGGPEASKKTAAGGDCKR
jgi:response regulator RpfG family c-di-GMP phosphodiesterase